MSSGRNGGSRATESPNDTCGVNGSVSFSSEKREEGARQACEVLGKEMKLAVARS